MTNLNKCLDTFQQNKLEIICLFDKICKLFRAIIQGDIYDKKIKRNLQRDEEIDKILED